MLSGQCERRAQQRAHTDDYAGGAELCSGLRVC